MTTFDQRGQRVLGSQFNSGQSIVEKCETWVISATLRDTGKSEILGKFMSKEDGLPTYRVLEAEWKSQWPNHKYRSIALLVEQ